MKGMNGVIRRPLLHEELTGRVLEACFEVSNELGCGFLESVYQNALAIALESKGFTPQKEVSLDVQFRNQVVGKFFADIVIESKIIVELKAVKALVPEHCAQVLNYLNGTGIEVGLLVNFGQPRLEYRRLERRTNFDASSQLPMSGSENVYTEYE
jgi:GxxExxY protein